MVLGLFSPSTVNGSFAKFLPLRIEGWIPPSWSVLRAC